MTKRHETDFKVVYRVHVDMVTDGRMSTYAFQGDDLKKVARKAKRLVDIMQASNPQSQANFFLYKAQFEVMVFPDLIMKELLEG